jgi:class 3 adenylate cyclase
MLFRFLLFLAFAGLPVALFFYDAHLASSIAAAKELDDLREQARGQIENLRRSGSTEAQLLDAFRRFLLQTARVPAGRDGDIPREDIRILYERLLADILPPHDIAVVHVSGKTAKTLLLTSQKLGLTSMLAETFAVAAIHRKPASAFTTLSKRLADILHCPFSPEALELLLPGWRGTVQAVYDVSRTRALFWDSVSPANANYQIVILSVFEYRQALQDESFAQKILLQGGESDVGGHEFGVAMIPNDGGSPRLSRFIEKRPALSNYLRDVARGTTALAEEEIMGDIALFKGDSLIGQDFFPVLAYPLRIESPHISRLEKAMRVLFGICIFFAFVVVGRRVVQTNGLPFGLGPGIFLAFVLVALLPIVIAGTVFRGTIFQQERTERVKVAERLHHDLVQIDEGFSYVHSAFRGKIRNLVRQPGFPETLQQIEKEVNGDTLAKSGQELLSSQGILTAYSTVPGTRAKLRSDGSQRDLKEIFHLIGLMGGNNVRKSWPSIMSKDTPNQADEMGMGSKDELLEFFSYLNRKILAMMDEAYEKKNPRKVDQKTFARAALTGAKHDEMFRSFSTMGGTGLFLGIVHFPEKEIDFKLSIGKTYILQTLLYAGKQLTNALLWVWSNVAIEETYLQNLLQDAHDTFGIMKRELGRECAFPRPIAKQSPLYDLVGKVERTGVGGRTQSEKGTFVMEARPAAQMPSFILAGARDTSHISKAGKWNQYLFQGGMFCLLVLAAMIAILGTAYFITPLQEILEKMAAVNNRRYDVSLDDSRPDEFGTLARAFNHMVKGLREGQLLRRFVSTSVKRAIRADSSGAEASQGVPKKITALFSSLHAFGNFVGSHPPAEVFAAFEAHLKAVNDASERFGGEIDKIMGEKILLVFYHDDFPNDREAGLAALSCAREIMASMERSGPVSVSIGINSGTAISGILGVRSVRVDFTVIGDAVNLAARLCAVAHDVVGHRVVISGETLPHVKDVIKTQKLPVTQVKGKTQSVEAFQVLPS